MATLVQYEYIVAVATYQRFSTAAEKCFVTQPTLSMQIKKLEEELGVHLFDRSKQPIIPTDIGKKVVAQARVILQEAERMRDIIERFQNDVEGELRVGIIPTLAPYLLPLFVGDFIRKYPKISLQVRELTTEEIIKGLEMDELDAGLLVTPLKHERIQEQPLFYEHILLYTHPEHPLAQEPKVDMEALNSSDIWLLSEGHCFRYQMINLCSVKHRIDDRSLPFDYESGSLESLRRLVDREGGFTLLPELAVLDWEEDKRARVRELEEPIPLREVSLVHIRNTAKTKRLELLSESVKAAIPEHLLEKRSGLVVEWK